jgi:hypothetical protein
MLTGCLDCFQSTGSREALDPELLQKHLLLCINKVFWIRKRVLRGSSGRASRGRWGERDSNPHGLAARRF